MKRNIHIYVKLTTRIKEKSVCVNGKVNLKTGNSGNKTEDESRSEWISARRYFEE